MERFDRAIHRPMRWVQPKMLDMAYELLDGDALVATLAFRSSFGSFATFRTSDGAWTFKRVGFWQTSATVRAEGQSADLARFLPNTWSAGGTLTLSDGRALKITTNLWQSKIECLRGDGETLFRYDTEGFIRQEASLTVGHLAGGMPELPWLIGFGWYLAVTLHQDSSAAIVIMS